MTHMLGLNAHNLPESKLLEVRWRAGVAPHYPSTLDNMSGVVAGLDRNNELGDCGPTSADNHRRVKTKRELGKQIDSPLADVLELYAESSDPPFNPLTGENDNGVTMPALLNAMRRVGLGGERIVAFGRLRDTSDASIMAAIYVFKAVLFAVDLQRAQDAQSDDINPVWDYVQSSPEWGGHAVVAGAYNAVTETVDVFSWAKRIGTTKDFRDFCLSEVWVPIYQSTIDDAHDAVDWDSMAASYTSLTGETLPASTPSPTPEPIPEPAPTPVPAPTPGVAPFPGATVEVASHIASSAARAHLSVTDWMNHHFQTYFK